MADETPIDEGCACGDPLTVDEAAPYVLDGLTQAKVDGTGVFDVLMRAFNVHIDKQFKDGRIKGPEYATVYLGGMQAALEGALRFLSQVGEDKLKYQLMKQQIINAGEEMHVLQGQACKLKAEFDLTKETTEKTAQEKALLTQKVVTERAQTQGIGVDDNSVIGKQKTLYQAQTDGFKRDAEQKAAKALIDTWSVRRTTDEGTVADGTNKLDDATIGRVIGKLLEGVQA